MDGSTMASVELHLAGVGPGPKLDAIDASMGDGRSISLKRCPNCQWSSNPEEASFCTQCGASLSIDDGAAGDDLPSINGDAIKRQAYEDIAAATNVTEGDAMGRAEPSDVSETPDAEAPRAPETWADPDQAPFELEINNNHFYMQGKVGVVDFKLRNLSDREITNFRLGMTCDYFVREHTLALPRMSPGRAFRRRLQVMAKEAGEFLINLRVECELDGEPRVYTAQQSIRVLEPNKEVNHLAINASMNVSAGGDLGFGASIRNEVAEQLAKGVVKTTNDLITQTFADAWEAIHVEYDDYESDLLRPEPRELTIVEQLPRMAAPMVQAMFVHGHAESAPRTMLLALPTIRMGRNRQHSDLVLRVLPRSEKHDELSRQITGSRPHCTIALTDAGLVLTDHETTNGTVLDGEAVTGETAVPLDRASTLEVGKAISLELTPFTDHTQTPELTDVGLGAVDNLWVAAERAGLRSLLIRRLSNLQAQEQYLIVYRWAQVGNDEHCEIRISSDAAEPTRGRVIRRGGQWWLQRWVSEVDFTVGQIPLAANQAAALSPDLPVRIGDDTLVFREARQAGL